MGITGAVCGYLNTVCGSDGKIRSVLMHRFCWLYCTEGIRVLGIAAGLLRGQWDIITGKNC